MEMILIILASTLGMGCIGSTTCLIKKKVMCNSKCCGNQCVCVEKPNNDKDEEDTDEKQARRTEHIR